MAVSSFMESLYSLYTQEDAEFKVSVPYTVRNTFIEATPQVDESSFEGVFSTWPLRAPPEVHASEARRAPVDIAGGSGADAGAGLPRGEDGEILDSEGEDGEILEESEEEEEEEVPRPAAQAGAKEKAQEKALVRQQGERMHAQEKEPQRQQGELEEGEVLEVLEERGLPGRPANGASRPPVSLGSSLHDQGRCRPCAWLHKSAEGCRHGERCEFCHLCGPGEIKRRKRVKAQLSLEEQVKRHQALLASTGLRGCFAAGGGGGGGGGGAGAAGRLYEAKATAGTALGAALSLEPCYVDVPLPRRECRTFAAHAVGQCRPCVWVHKEAGGCRNGDRCKYCHLCPPGEVKRRKRQKRLMQAMMEMATNVAHVPLQVKGGDAPSPQRCYPGM